MPTTTRPAGRQILTATGHLLWTSAVVVGAPLALWRFFEWPLPTEVPDWGEVVSTPLHLVDPVVILNSFVCLAWLCWAVVATYVALDAIDAARGVGHRLHSIGPFNTVATKLVGSVVLLTSLARPTATLATPAAPAPVVHVVDAPGGPTPTATPALPGDPSPTGPRGDPASTEPASTTAAQPVYVVQRGDSHWAIAKAHLGSGFRWSEIHDLNRSLIADPDIICVGWQLTLPFDADISTLDTPAPEPTTIPTPEPSPLPPAAEPATPVPAPPPPRSGTEAQPADAPPPTAAVPQGDTAEPSEATPRMTEMPASLEPTQPVGATDETAPLPSLAALVPGITGATVLASSLLLLLRRAQQRRNTSVPRTRRPTLPLERTIVAAADVPLVRWAGQELAVLGEQLTGRRIDADPVAVEFSAESGLELLWDRPFPDAPSPWEAVPGAWAWRLLYDPEAPVPAPDQPALIAGLVTVGHRDGRQLMVDLEGLGTLAITGAADAIAGFLRSVALELGAGDEVADAYVSLTSGVVDLPSVQHLPRVRVEEPPVAINGISATAKDVQRSLDEIGCSSTFAYRLFDSPVLPVDVAVMITDAVSVDADFSAIAPPRRGVAAIVNGELPGSHAHLHIEADGTARLEPLGISFRAAGVDAATDDAIAELLDQVAEPLTEAHRLGPPEEAPVSRTTVAVDHDDGETNPAIDVLDEGPCHATDEIDLRDCPEPAGPPTDNDDWEPTRPRLLVRLLGEPTIVGGPAMSRREMIVVATMACLGRPARQEDIQEAVWGGEAVVPRTIWNMVGRTRKQLGEWDGQPILSTADRRHNTYRLADGLVTDVALMRELYDRAREVPSSEAGELLRSALAFVDGPPFDADGYEWARVNQHAHDAERLIEDAATMLAELALLADDLDTARYAVTQGLRGLPGNEVLYRARMRIEHAAGNTTAVRTAYRELTDYLDDLGAEPSQETQHTFTLTATARQAARSTAAARQ